MVVPGVHPGEPDICSIDHPIPTNSFITIASLRPPVLLSDCFDTPLFEESVEFAL